MKRHIGTNPEKQDDLEREVNYFRENASRMKSAEFKKQRLFVGSGVIEAGCKNALQFQECVLVFVGFHVLSFGTAPG